MGFFDPPSVNALKKECEFIGGLFGSVHLGQFSAADLNELVHSEGPRARLQAAFAQASAEVGDAKALKAARWGANLGADAYARLGRGPYGEVVRAAEDTVESIVRPARDVSVVDPR